MRKDDITWTSSSEKITVCEEVIDAVMGLVNVPYGATRFCMNPILTVVASRAADFGDLAGQEHQS